MKETNDNYLQEDIENIVNSMDFSQLKNSTVYVTGATGLVGSRLILTLLCANRLFDTNITILASVRSIDKAKYIYGNSFENAKLTFVIQDLINPIVVSDNIDYIIHCASVTTSKTMVQTPVETIKTAIIGTMNVLELAKNKDVRSFVYISSMEMYGTFDTTEFITENQIGYINPLVVRSNYPESKRMCENMCIAYLTEYGVPVRIARLSQVFGAGVLPGENRVFAQFAKSVINGTDIVLHTQGKSEGNYCYLADAIEAIVLILLKGEIGNAYNVVNEESHTTIADMANMVANKVAAGKIKVVFDIPEENVYGYANDTKLRLCSKKLASMGWSPRYSLEESYRRLIESLRIMDDFVL